MQNDSKRILIELAPQFFIIVVIIFGSLIAINRVKKNTKKSLEDLRKQDTNKYKKITKYNAYLKSSLWSVFGLFLLGGSIYNSLLFPNQNRLPALFTGVLGLCFIGFGIFSYFKETRKIQE